MSKGCWARTIVALPAEKHMAPEHVTEAVAMARATVVGRFLRVI